MTTSGSFLRTIRESCFEQTLLLNVGMEVLGCEFLMSIPISGLPSKRRCFLNSRFNLVISVYTRNPLGLVSTPKNRTV